MPIKAEELRVSVTADTKPAQKDLGKFNKEVGKSSPGLDLAKKAVAGFTAAAAIGFAGKAIMAASDLNEVVSKTGVVFGDQTSEVTGYAQKMADSFGLPKTAVLDAASSFGLLGKAAGLGGKDVAKMSTGLAGLAADASSFYNVPLDQALEDFRSGLSGEAEPLRKYGVMINDAAVQTEALALGLVKPVKNVQALKAAQVNAAVAQKAYSDAVRKHGPASLEAQKAQVALQKAQDGVAKAAKGAIPALTEGQKVQARTSLITKGLSDANGDLARTQTSVSNRIRELKGRALNMAADFGTKLLPAVAAVLGGLISFAGTVQKVTGFLGDHGKAVGIVAGVIGTLLLPMIITWGVQSTIAAAKSVAAWVTTQAAAISSSYAQIGAFAKMVAGWVASAAAATASGIETLLVWTMYKVESAKAAAAFVANIARMVAGWVLVGVQSLLSAAKVAAAWLIAMGPIGLVIAAVIGLVVLIIKNWDTIKAATVAVWGAISSAVTGAVSWVVGFVKSHWPLLLAIIAGPIGLAVLAVVKNWDKIKAATSAVWSWIKGKVSGAAGAVKSAVAGAFNAMVGVVSGAWGRVKSAVSTGISRVLSLVRALPGRIVSGLGNIGSTLYSSGKSIIQGLINGIKDMAGNVKGAVEGVLKKARDLLPFSPAKEGPFSGRGWTLYSGRAIGQSLADGMKDQYGTVAKGALGLAQAAVPRVGGLQVPAVGVQARSGAYSGSAATRTALTGTAPQQAGPMVGTQNVYYPVAEATSTATNRGLQRVATLTLA